MTETSAQFSRSTRKNRRGEGRRGEERRGETRREEKRIQQHTAALTWDAYMFISAGVELIMPAVFLLNNLVSPHVLSQSKCTYLPIDTLPRPLRSRVIPLLINTRSLALSADLVLNPAKDSCEKM